VARIRREGIPNDAEYSSQELLRPGSMLLGAVLSPAQPAPAQTSTPQAKLSAHWEELTGADFVEAIKRSQGTCVLPFGILEKHGPHLPLGTDLLDVRYAALHACGEGVHRCLSGILFRQIFEARHEPGTIAYSRDLQLALLQETTDEIGTQRLQEGADREWPRWQ